MYFLENQDETRNFATTYRDDIGSIRHLPKKFIAKSFAPQDDLDLKNPITDPYRELLNTKSKNDRLPFNYRTASAEENYRDVSL